MEKIILASASPRRKEIFELAGIDFEIKTAPSEQKIDDKMNVEDAVVNVAASKAKAVLENNIDKTVVGADTVVVCDGKILGKPKDCDDAFKMLKSLSGRMHRVYTGVFVCKKGFEKGFAAKTDVSFYPLSDDEIRSYINTGEPMDKAGAYGIQSRGLKLVKSINGDFYNVMGFPAAEFLRKMKEWGIEL